MKQRIEYIDLMKGLCITLVVMSHSGLVFDINVMDSMLRVFRIPLYFFLSGLFFKRYNGFCDFLVRKFNKLIIPLFFFAYIPYGLLAPIFISELNFKNFILMGIMPYNEPLWFLRSLFVTYLLAYPLSTIKGRYKVILVAVVVIFFSYVASFFHKQEQDAVYLHYLYQVITSFIALPFFCLASFLNGKGFLEKKFHPMPIILGVFIVLTLLYITRVAVDYRTASYGNNVLFMYVGAFSGIYVVWSLCYLLKHLFFFSYIGKYSLIVLGTHFPIIICFQTFGISSILSFLFTMLLMPPIIYLFIRYFPYFTAQKDLIIYSNGKVFFARTKCENINTHISDKFDSIK